MESAVVRDSGKMLSPSLTILGLNLSLKLGRVSELTLQSQVTFNYHYDSASWTASQPASLPARLPRQTQSHSRAEQT